MLQWPPRDFWDATVADVSAAYHGFASFHGQKTEEDFMTLDELEELKRKWPDKKPDDNTPDKGGTSPPVEP